jgi:hypothetical protein
MAGIRKTKKDQRYVLVQFRLHPFERDRLRILAAELGLSMQQFLLKLLKGTLKSELQSRRE